MSSLPPHLYTEEIVRPRPASTVVPVRDGGGGIEVYMTKRSSRLRFLGGYHVFPGGAVDAQDSHPDAISRCCGLTPIAAQRILNCETAPDGCLAHWVAAIRELFEEAGILLAYSDNGDVPDFNVRRIRKRCDKYRELINKKSVDMNYMMRRLKLTYATDMLLYFSHWITPPGPPKRFDTRFFVAPVPQSQRPRRHEEEVSEGEWIRADYALEKSAKSEWKMIPPTLISLQQIARFSSVAALVKALGPSA